MSHRTIDVHEEEGQVVVEASPVRRSLGLDDLSTRSRANSNSERSLGHDVNIHGPQVNPTRDELDLMVAESQREYETQDDFDKAIFLESRFAFTVTILSGIAAIMGFQFNGNPLFTINAEGCNAEATPSNQSADTWYMIPNYGCCPRSGITLTCAEVNTDTDESSNNDCETEMLNCITFNNATEWQRWDTLNAEQGYVSHFAQESGRWTGAATEFFAIFQVVLATALAIVVGDMLLCILVIGPIYDTFRHLALRKANHDLPVASYIDDRGWGAMRLERDTVADNTLDLDTHGDSYGHDHDHGEVSAEAETMSRTAALTVDCESQAGEVEMSNRDNTAAIVAIDEGLVTPIARENDNDEKEKKDHNEKEGSGKQSVLQIGLSDILTVHERLSAEDVVYDLEGQRVIHGDGEELVAVSGRSRANSATSSLGSPNRQDSLDGADTAPASQRQIDDVFGYDAILLHLGYTREDKKCFDPNVHCKSRFREIVSRNYPFFKCCCILQLVAGIWLIELWNTLHDSDLANASAWKAYQLSSCTTVEFQQGRVVSDYHFICFVVFFTGVTMLVHCVCFYLYGKGLVHFCMRTVR